MTERLLPLPLTRHELGDWLLRDLKKRGDLNRRPTQLSEGGRAGLRVASATRRP
jgi:hypothetical protein